MSQQLLKDIWQKHTEVQEQLLQQRSAPIPIDEKSIIITGDKLTLSVDESNRTDKILSQIVELFKLSEQDLDLTNGCFFSDSEISNSISIDAKRTLSEAAELNHIKFRPNPIVDGVIVKKNSSLIKVLKKNNCDYSFDKKGRLQISISDLEQIQSELKENNVQIPSNVSVIFKFTPSPLLFLQKMLPNIPWCHMSVFYENNRGGRDILSDLRIILKDGYLSNDILQVLYEKIGLKLNRYFYTFHVKDGQTFCFTTKIKDEKSKDDLNDLFEEQFDYNFKFTRLRQELGRKYGFDNISFESSFEYSYDKHVFNDVFLKNQTNWEEQFWDIIYDSFQNQSISISRNYEIGVDFDWEKESLKDVLSRVSSLCPFIVLSHFKNHRCNIDLKFQNASLKGIEEQIRASFPSIQFDSSEKGDFLYFFQEYIDNSKRNQIVRSLEDELKQLSSSEYSYEIYPLPPNKVKYYVKVDTESLQESLSDAVKDLRGCDFYIDGVNIGKLIRTRYPLLFFDISSSNKDVLRQIIDNKCFNEIRPDLTGDLEKIARLKKSFETILSGNGLCNPNLSEFIFDAAKARPIENIDYYTHPQSDFYEDVNTNLLNRKVNESQKQAIIKTMLAEDLTIIQGPPGTGKSTAIAEIMWQHIRKNPKERILLTSETNLAVDNAIARVVNTTHNLVKPVRIGGEEKLEMEGKQFNVDILKAWVDNGVVSYSDLETENDDEEIAIDEQISQKIILENWLANIARRVDVGQMREETSTLWLNFLQNPTKEVRQKVFENYIHNCNVVGATCSSIGEKNTKGSPTSFYRTYCELFGKVESRTNKDGKKYSNYSGKIKFDTVIQDESSKATPAELSLPLIYGNRNIIIGDHRQLPPLLDKEEFISSLKFLLNNLDDAKSIKEIKKLQKYVQQHFKEMEVSHFQRLFEAIDDSLKGVFNQQYRMHPAINEVIKQFYVEDGGLYCGLDPNVIESPDVLNPQSRFHGLNIEGFLSPETHVVWIDTNTPEMLVGTSRVNYGEVEAIHRVLTLFHQSDSFWKYQNLWSNDEDKQIGLISFYGKQLKLLKGLRSDFRDIPIRISTVDRFQGMERNIIIVSMVRSNIIAADKNQQADYEQYPELGFAHQNDLGFAQSPNRLNVALSRAKRLLIIVGNSKLFRQKEIYNNVYNCIENTPYGKIVKAEEL